MAKGISVPVTATGLDASISNAVKKVGAINIPVNVDPSAFKNLAQPLGRVSGLATEFEKSIAASNARVLAFGASVGIINGVQNAFASLLQTGIEVQKTLAEIAAISGQSGETLAKFGDSLFEVGKLTGQSFKTAAQAALEFSRQGLSTEETLKRTTDALTLTRFTTLNAAEAVDILTAAANSFGDTGITTTEILNKLVAVDTKFAVSAEDLANGLARAGSIAQEVGVSFDELNAAITVAQERTARGGSVIGNALKTIFTRLRSDETVQALRAIGVESLNAQGGLKGAIPLLEEVAQKLQGLSEGERVQILEAIASKYNINILSAILTDLSDANKKFGEIVGISASAGNQAYERQIQLNETLAAQINITTVSVQQLFNKLAEIGVTESLGNLLKFVNGLLDGINKILDSESTGGNIAKGLIKGISEIFFTVGLPLLGAIFVKLTKDIAQFGVESLKTILGINQQVRERQALEQAVVNTLIRDQEIMATILSLSGNRAKQEEYLLSVYNRQLAALQQVQSIAAGVAPALQAAGLSATSGTVKRRAAEGYLPAAEARDVRRGVGGASPSSKVVEIPNFSFGGGKRGTMVANTSEYIVPNYAGGSGMAIFNQDMVKQYGLPPGAKKITASGGFVPASGFVPNFAEAKFNVQNPRKRVLKENESKSSITNIDLDNMLPSAYLTISNNPDTSPVGVFSSLQEAAKQKLQEKLGQPIDPSARIEGENIEIKKIQNSYASGGQLIGSIIDAQRKIQSGKANVKKESQIIVDRILPETSGGLDDNLRNKLIARVENEIKTTNSPFFAAGNILEDVLFASTEGDLQDRNSRSWDLPRNISPNFKKAFNLKSDFADIKLGKTERSMSSFLGKHITAPSGTNASRGYIPNFINSGFVWTGVGERLENYGPEDVVPAGNATRGKKWERVKNNYRKATEEELNAFAAKAAKQMNENISVTAQHPAGAVMLVPKQEQAAAVNKDSQSFGFKPKDGLKTPEGEGINFVKFAAFGVNDEKFKSKSGAKMSDIQMRIKSAIGSIGADIANDFKVLTKEPLDKDGFYKLFDKKQGAGGSVSAVAGSIFEAATDYTLNPAGNPDFSDPDTSFDVGSLTPNLIDVFDIKGDYGPGTKADFKISEARARAFADQVVLNKVYKKVDKATGLAKAAKGYIPNFAGKYYYDPNLIAKEDDVVKGEDGKDVKNATLKKALASRKRINVLIGPVGSGKTTFAQASGGTFLRKPSDVDLADEITILQTSHTSTKTGGISDNMRQILDAATGQVSYLDVSDEVISERRKVRSAQAEAGQIVGDTRSTKQIVSGDQFAEKKSPNFIQAVQEYLKTKGKTLNMIKGSEGYIPNFAPADPLSSLATTKQFKNDSSSSAGLEESINTAAKNAYKPFSKRRNITAGVSKNLVGNEAGTKKFRDALNSGIPVADFIGFQAATVGAPRPNISGKPEDLEKDLASLRFFNKDINGPRPALRAVTTNPDDSEVLAPASQFYDLKTAIGFAKAATVSLTQAPVGKTAARGFVSNFVENEPLKEAISREVAAGISPARVRVTQDDRLQNSKNPEGLAVINTRDEPNGKIPNNFRKRAAVQEVASRGFVPNFAKQRIDANRIFGKAASEIPLSDAAEQLNSFAQQVIAGKKTTEEFNKKAKEVSDKLNLQKPILDKYNAEVTRLSNALAATTAAQTKAAATVAATAAPAMSSPATTVSVGAVPAGAATAATANTQGTATGQLDGVNDSAKKTKVGLDKMFYALSGITTLSYTLQSVFKDTESGLAKFTVGVASAAQTASQFALLGGGLRELTDSFKLQDKGGLLGGLGKASQALPIAGAVIGAGVGIYQAFADADQKDKDKRISEIQKDYARRVSIEEAGLNDQEKLQAAQQRLQERKKEEAAAEQELQRKLNDPSRLKNQKESVGDIKKRLEAKKEEVKLDESSVKAAQDAVDSNKKRSGREASRITQDLEKRAVLEKELGKLSEAFSKAENEALLSRVKNRIKINEQVLLGTQYQKEEAALQIKLTEFENQKQDAKRSSLEATLKELANMSSLANVDKAALEILMAKIRANGSIAGLEKEINALQGDGILKARSILESQTSTLNRTLASIDARKTEATLLDFNERKVKSILAIEQLISQSIADRIKNVDEARSASQANEADRASLERQLRVKRVEDKIAGRPFATPDQKLALLKAQAETRQEEEISRVRQTAATRLQDQYIKLREEIVRQASSLSYLDSAYRKQFENDILQANNIENITERFAKLKEIRDRIFNQKIPETAVNDKYFEFKIEAPSILESKMPKAKQFFPEAQSFGGSFLEKNNTQIDKFASKIEEIPSALNNLGSLVQDSFSFNQPTKDLELFLAKATAGENKQKEYQAQKTKAESSLEMLLTQQEEARNKNNALDVIRIELAMKALTYEQKIEEIRTRSRSAAGFTRAFDDLSSEAEGFTEKFSYDTTFAFRDGLRDALGAAISQTDDLNGALQNVAMNFLKTMQNALLNNAVNSLMIGAGNAFPGVFGGLGKAKGGYVKGYASGGLVTGGSGYKDDVPAMLSAGEYVIRKSSVEKYGASNLQKLNSGDPPKFASGGIFLPGVRGGTAISGYKDLTAFANQTTTSGATDILMGGRSTAFASLEDQSARLSNYALLNEDDVINREIRSAQEQGLNLISEREKYRTQKRKAFQKQLVGTAVSAALSFGLSKITSGAGSAASKANTGIGLGLKDQAAGNTQFLKNATVFKGPGQAYGGLIRRYATGGGPTDDVPALLMDGEYVMSRQATSKYGKKFLDSINQGRAPRFAGGGQVSTSEPSFAEKAAAMSDSKTDAGTNVSININVTGQTSQTQTEGETKNKGVDYKEMGKQIEQIVLKTLAEQRRPGGMLKPSR